MSPASKRSLSSWAMNPDSRCCREPTCSSQYSPLPFRLHCLWRTGRFARSNQRSRSQRFRPQVGAPLEPPAASSHEQARAPLLLYVAFVPPGRKLASFCISASRTRQQFVEAGCGRHGNGAHDPPCRAVAAGSHCGSPRSRRLGVRRPAGVREGVGSVSNRASAPRAS